MRGPKPDKPRANFPLTAFASGVWGKKIKGKIYYFGGWSDPDAAEAEYLRQKEYLQAGKIPPPKVDARITMRKLCSKFMNAKQIKVDLGKMKPGQLIDYDRSCARLVKLVGLDIVVEDLTPADFDKLASDLGKGVNSVTFANRVRMARGVFKFAADRDHISKKLVFGDNFVLPSPTDLREQDEARGELDFTAEEILSILDATKGPLHTMVLLAINCGFGNNDCSSLPIPRIDLEAAVINFPRPKTKIKRKAPLWKETVTALRESIGDRYTPHDEQFNELVFITKYGNPYVRMNEKGVNFDSIAMEFAKVLKELGLNGRRRGFYSLRRTFQTIGEEPGDLIAVQHIMGHQPGARDMAARYRQRVSHDRLLKVTNYVHDWLWPPKKKTRSVKAKQ